MTDEYRACEKKAATNHGLRQIGVRMAKTQREIFIVAGALILVACGDSLSAIVTSGDVKKLESLLFEGADPNSVIVFKHRSFAGGKEVKRTLLVAAAVHGHVQIVELLISRGVALEHPDNAFALCPAAAFGYTEIVATLVRAGVSVNPTRKCGRNGSMSPLRIAQKGGYDDIIKTLVEAGAEQ